MRAILRLSAIAGLAMVTAITAPLAAQDQEIPWEDGPVDGSLGTQSKVKVADGCRFTAAEGTQAFMRMTENPTNGRERGTALCHVVRADGDTSYWFAVFEWDASGYVKDDEKGNIDGDAILKSLKEGNQAGNRERRKQGWSTIDLIGWERAPYYDDQTKNLTWATLLRDTTGSETINHSVRLLGRAGVISVDLVTSKEDYAAALPAFEELIATHEYLEGHRYSEWREGDKIAAYGLTALVAGGAGVLAAQTGLLAKLWKVIAGVVVAAIAGIKRLFGGKKQ